MSGKNNGMPQGRILKSTHNFPVISSKLAEGLHGILTMPSFRAVCEATSRIYEWISVYWLFRNGASRPARY